MTEFVALTGWAWLLGIMGLGVAAGIYGYVKKQPPGNETMIDIGEQIHDGAMAFLRREYTVLSVFVVAVAILLGVVIGPMTAGAYVFGAFSSVAAGFFGMKAATRANTRTSAAATTGSSGNTTVTPVRAGTSRALPTRIPPMSVMRLRGPGRIIAAARG